MNVKKFALIAACILLVFASCNRKKFVKKLTGTWSLSRYYYAGKDETASMRDTAMNQYKLSINEDQAYLETWRSLTFTGKLHINPDTLGYDSTNMVYNVKFDTIPYVDTTITLHGGTGRWDLLNSESDLQLRGDSANDVRIFQILKLTGSNLNLQNGNVEMDLNK